MKVVGTSVKRPDARAKLTGRAVYADDVVYPDMVYVAVVRSPYPRAAIRGIDDSLARQVHGYLGMFTAKDIVGENVVPLVMRDMPVLAEHEVRFHGEAVALVAANTKDAARKAAKLVKVDYEELPTLLDPLRALEPDAPKIYGDDNVFKRWVIKKGEYRSSD